MLKTQAKLNTTLPANYKELFAITEITPLTLQMDAKMRQPEGTRRILNGNIFTFTYDPNTSPKRIIEASVKPYGEVKFYKILMYK